uniref:Uncharacterized protein n=1 Tax=Proteus vulgaris TaxID=585 RepID=Q8KKB3_PROVU|nr:hypothetical protein [Proteus vulgaris]
MVKPHQQGADLREEGERSWGYFRHKPDKLNQHAIEGGKPLRFAPGQGAGHHRRALL